MWTQHVDVTRKETSVFTIRTIQKWGGGVRKLQFSLLELFKNGGGVRKLQFSLLGLFKNGGGVGGIFGKGTNVSA